MHKKILFPIMMVMTITLVISCQQPPKTESQMEKEHPGTATGQQALTPASQEHVAQRLATFAPFTLTSDISHLSAKEKQMLSIFFDVADIMDELFWMQAMGPKDPFLARIQDETTKKFAMINYGPWDRLGGNESFSDERFI
ncbi:MAG: Zn-dependent hydrolase, partial [Bacteroidales bacterium]|nr:Zn-dependent hydrolase [Bacteroidales bacterium]